MNAVVAGAQWELCSGCRDGYAAVAGRYGQSQVWQWRFLV